MRIKHIRFPIGLRTLKTAIAVIVAMIIVNAYGATTSKLIFATLGAMAAMEHTLKESLEACLTQIIGVLFGALVSILLIEVQFGHLLAAGIGIILVITSYNLLRIHFSPSLPCVMVVILCTSPEVQPIGYALSRCWDTMIGLGVGLLINTLVFPYDNRRNIRTTAESLDRELLVFLEDMFDGDDHLPDTGKMMATIDNMQNQLTILSRQWMILTFRRRRREFEAFQRFEGKARQVVAHMEVLCRMGRPGHLSDENEQRLLACGAKIEKRQSDGEPEERDIVINYHVSQILILRQDLLNALKKAENPLSGRG